jgi:hypothetical protein
MDAFQLFVRKAQIIEDIRDYVINDSENLPKELALQKTGELDGSLSRYLGEISGKDVQDNQDSIRKIVSKFVKEIDAINLALDCQLIETHEREEIAKLFMDSSYLAGFKPTEEEYGEITDIEDQIHAILELPFDRTEFGHKLRSNSFDVTRSIREHW